MCIIILLNKKVEEKFYRINDERGEVKVKGEGIKNNENRMNTPMLKVVWVKNGNEIDNHKEKRFTAFVLK